MGSRYSYLFDINSCFIKNKNWITWLLLQNKALDSIEICWTNYTRGNPVQNVLLENDRDAGKRKKQTGEGGLSAQGTEQELIVSRTWKGSPGTRISDEARDARSSRALYRSCPGANWHSLLARFWRFARVVLDDAAARAEGHFNSLCSKLRRLQFSFVQEKSTAK